MPRFLNRPCHVDIGKPWRNPMSFPLHEQAVLNCIAAMSLDDDSSTKLSSKSASTTSSAKQESISTKSAAPFLDTSPTSFMQDVEMTEGETNDSWGQFIDTSQAEEELIQSSEILSHSNRLQRCRCSPVDESWPGRA